MALVAVVIDWLPARGFRHGPGPSEAPPLEAGDTSAVRPVHRGTVTAPLRQKILREDDASDQPYDDNVSLDGRSPDTGCSAAPRDPLLVSTQGLASPRLERRVASGLLGRLVRLGAVKVRSNGLEDLLRRGKHS